MRAAFIGALRADSAVAALVGARVHYLLRPQGGALPAVTCQQISGARLYSHEGPGGLVNGRMQVDCWAETAAGAAALATAVRRAIEGNGFSAGGETVDSAQLIAEQDFSEKAEADGVRVFRASLDFGIWFKEN